MISETGIWEQRTKKSIWKSICLATYLKQVYKFIVCQGQTLCIFSATKYLIYSIDSYFSYDKTGFDLLHGMGCSRNFDFCSNLLKIYVKVGWKERDHLGCLSPFSVLLWIRANYLFQTEALYSNVYVQNLYKNMKGYLKNAIVHIEFELN